MIKDGECYDHGQRAEREVASVRDWIIFILYLLLPWLVLWILGERDRFREALPGGLIMVIMAMTLDELGSHYGFWRYPLNPFEQAAISLPFDLVSFSAEGILINGKALNQPNRAWSWVISLALANSAAEFFAVRYTRLAHYPAWTPLASVPIYVLLFWITIWFTRWFWRPKMHVKP